MLYYSSPSLDQSMYVCHSHLVTRLAMLLRTTTCVQEWKTKRQDLLGRTEFVGGDFFNAATLPKADPASRDVFMLRCVLHDWNDEKTRAILRSLRTAMGEPVVAFDAPFCASCPPPGLLATCSTAAVRSLLN